MSVVLNLENVKKHYKLYPSHIHMALDVSGYYKARFWKPSPKFTIKKALEGVSLEVKRGDRLGILGRNGAGKTTMLKLAAGMISPSSGKITTHGSVQTLMHIGAAFHADFSGAENIRHGLLYNGLRGKALDRAFDDVVDFSELGDFINQPVRNYSLGMTTRLQFAVATAVRPEILIIDEVLGAGDAYFAAKSADRMRALTRSGCTLLLVSHARSQIMEFCTSALWLDQGEMRQHGALDSVLAAYDKEIASALSVASGAEKRGGVLPIPSYMYRQDYTAAMSSAVDCLYGAGSWCPSDLENAILCMRADVDGGQRRIDSVRMELGGVSSNVGSTGDTAKILVRVSKASNYGNKSGLVCRLLFFSSNGALVAETKSRVISAKDSQAFDFCLSLAQIPFGHREYSLAVILESGGKVTDAQLGFYIKISETNDVDPPLLHYPAKWYQNAGENSVPARISGVQ